MTPRQAAERRPRYIVRELEGFATAKEGNHQLPPGLTVWVADEAWNGREIRCWRTEDFGKNARVTNAERRARIRAEARKVADTLNATEALFAP